MAMQITLIVVVVVDFQDGHYDYHDSLQVRLIMEIRKFSYSAVVSSALSFFFSQILITTSTLTRLISTDQRFVTEERKLAHKLNPKCLPSLSPRTLKGDFKTRNVETLQGIILLHSFLSVCTSILTYYMALSHKDWELPNSRI